MSDERLFWATPVGAIHTQDRIADTPLGRYSIRPCGGGWHWLFNGQAHGVFASIEAAQAAAQQSFKERLTSGTANP